ncbi:efflux RND transporter periplasmic adaptor subunit [Prochlorococcus marinus]|uniref:Efflux RND transporter periplasmic adaptor subunit n=1 Tax=Prochlorococcus marinus XMU1408 TaxID=2213228 RepID=A0A318QX26_PROMR|nr:efflux RND transporter periplasmic adaptor subunit [Prochlorococcus marinus]MBW3042354.1 efflux RND transporter periplasmic adaptor subunit [Prochlorococcus marinus str. XMU1408]PYE01095.1 efflux RND transporter periplasmic adaptor subunit [Prochlorococcus marinus XMU1408]
MIWKNLKKKKVLGFVALSVLTIGGISFKLSKEDDSNKDLTAFTVSAENGSLPGLITASGELKANKSVNVSPKRQGILDEIFVEEGDQVMKGDLIAKMDFGDLEFRIDELRANYETQKASYLRRKILFNEGAISAEEYEEYKNRFLRSEAKFKQIEIEENETNIRAPFRGVVTSRYAVPGAFVTPTTSASSSREGGATSSSIVKLSQGLEIVAKVPESDIGRIKTGQEATIRVDAFPDKRFEAFVSKVSPSAIKNNNVTSFEVTLLLSNRPEDLRLGMTSDINFETGATKISTLIPTVAIVTEGGEAGVLIVGKNNQPTFKKVELGTSSGSKTAIISGLKPGEKVFIDLPPWAKKTKS